jgi:hypothetical protein
LDFDTLEFAFGFENMRGAVIEFGEETAHKFSRDGIVNFI